MQSKTDSLIGVIGGVGPHAGLDFVRKILINTQAERDQDHLNCILISCPSLIPDRTNFLLQSFEEAGENPAFGIFESARRLYMAGVQYVAVACNTAHSDRIFAPFCDMAQQSLPDMRIINMLETCAAYVKGSLQITCLGLLATKGTYKSRVYHEYFRREEGFDILEPETAGQERIHEAIYNEHFGIKSHSEPVTAQARNYISYEINRLIEQGAEGIILGCTELPLAVNMLDFPVPILDPGLITARRLITLTAPEKLLPEVL